MRSLVRLYRSLFVNHIKFQHVRYTVNLKNQTINYISQNDIGIQKFSTTSTKFKTKNRPKEKKAASKKADTFELKQYLEIDELLEEFERPIQNLKTDFVSHVSLRTNVGSLESIMVKYNNKKYSLDNLARISRRPKEVILDVSVTPQAIPSIVEALTASEMRLNPRCDGQTIYVPIPKVTKEYRESLAKSAKSFFDKHCKRIKDVRNMNVKTIQDSNEIPDDVRKRLEESIDLLSKEYIQKAKELLETKQNELLSTNN